MSIVTKPDAPIPPPPTPTAPTPLWWRLAIAAGVLALAGLAWLLDPVIGPRGRGALGVFCFIGTVAVFSANLRAVNWRTIGCGFGLQLLLALFVMRFEVFGYRPGEMLFAALGRGTRKFLDFTEKGSRFVFGVLADPETLGKTYPDNGFVFAFSALPTIIFVSSFFAILYYFGVLQFLTIRRKPGVSSGQK